MDQTQDLEKLQVELADIMAHFVEAWAAFTETIREIIDVIVEKVVKPFTRIFFCMRLSDYGIPDWLADFISRKWPWRWMPVEWIYAGLLDLG